ncbi:hypothetical protein RJ639_045925 [Escallonia herrerae]|uniref:Cyclin-like domain-containing protein n=1 Tax=Escallonia herrerae TaxID=1293975 RepID=A0AA89B4Z6_9ASTE|nr:hypothetical protein RJ639_045925 [Escallonia herrerae]
MAGQLPGNRSWLGIARDENSSYLHEGLQSYTRKWYFSKEEIEDHSPSRSDGIDQKEESHLRKLYCSFLQELGMELKVPQVTIATAVMLCHRFYMRQSHARNDWQTIASVCMFLACKAEETPRWLCDVVVVAYRLMYKWDPSAPQRIKQKEVYDKQRELILIGERLLLATVAFDLNIEHPYKPLVAALKKLETSHKDLVKVAWNFVNDWLRTTICLQYKPHYIAAGSIFLAAKFQKVKLPTVNGKVWWMQFDVTPKRLEEVIQQMMGLLEQNRKQVQPPVRRTVTDSKPGTGKAKSDSPQSCIISSGSVVAQDTRTLPPKEANPAISNCSQEPKCVEVQDVTKQASHCQTSDCGSAGSVVEDCDGKPGAGKADKDQKIASVAGTEVDITRIKELKRKRLDRISNVKSVKSMEDEIDSEVWIEKELENGIESQSAAIEKRRRF